MGSYFDRNQARQARERAERMAEKAPGSRVLADPTASRPGPYASDAQKATARRLFALWSKNGYDRGAPGARVRGDMASGQFTTAITMMEKTMAENAAPEGFRLSPKIKGVWIRVADGSVVEYWTPAGGVMTPDKFLEFMGEFDPDAKIGTNVERSAGFDGLREWIERSVEKGAQADEAYVMSALRQCLRDCCSYSAGREDAALCQMACDNLVSRLGYGDSKGNDMLARWLDKNGVEALESKATILLAEVKKAMPADDITKTQRVGNPFGAVAAANGV